MDNAEEVRRLREALASALSGARTVPNANDVRGGMNPGRDARQRSWQMELSRPTTQMPSTIRREASFYQKKMLEDSLQNIRKRQNIQLNRFGPDVRATIADKALHDRHGTAWPGGARNVGLPGVEDPFSVNLTDPIARGQQERHWEDMRKQSDLAISEGQIRDPTRLGDLFVGENAAGFLRGENPLNWMGAAELLTLFAAPAKGPFVAFKVAQALKAGKGVKGAKAVASETFNKSAPTLRAGLGSRPVMKARSATGRGLGRAGTATVDWLGQGRVGRAGVLAAREGDFARWNVFSSGSPNRDNSTFKSPTLFEGQEGPDIPHPYVGLAPMVPPPPLNPYGNTPRMPVLGNPQSAPPKGSQPRTGSVQPQHSALGPYDKIIADARHDFSNDLQLNLWAPRERVNTALPYPGQAPGNTVLPDNPRRPRSPDWNDTSGAWAGPWSKSPLEAADFPFDPGYATPTSRRSAGPAFWGPKSPPPAWTAAGRALAGEGSSRQTPALSRLEALLKAKRLRQVALDTERRKAGYPSPSKAQRWNDEPVSAHWNVEGDPLVNDPRMIQHNPEIIPGTPASVERIIETASGNIARPGSRSTTLRVSDDVVPLPDTSRIPPTSSNAPDYPVMPSIAPKSRWADDAAGAQARRAAKKAEQEEIFKENRVWDTGPWPMAPWKAPVQPPTVASRILSRLKNPAGEGNPILGMGVFAPDRRAAASYRRSLQTRRRDRQGLSEVLREAGKGRVGVASRAGGRMSAMWNGLSRGEKIAIEVDSQKIPIDQRIETIETDLKTTRDQLNRRGGNDTDRAELSARVQRLETDIDDLNSARPFIEDDVQGYASLRENVRPAVRTSADLMRETSLDSEARRAAAGVTPKDASFMRSVKEHAKLTRQSIDAVLEKLESGEMTAEQLGIHIPRGASRNVKKVPGDLGYNQNDQSRTSGFSNWQLGNPKDLNYSGYNQAHGLVDLAEGIDAVANHAVSTSHVIATKEVAQDMGREFGSVIQKRDDDIAIFMGDIDSGTAARLAHKQESTDRVSDLGGQAVRERKDSINDVLAGSFVSPDLDVIPLPVGMSKGSGTGNLGDLKSTVTVKSRGLDGKSVEREVSARQIEIPNIVYVNRKALGKALDGKRNIPQLQREVENLAKIVGKGFLDEINGAARLAILYLNPSYITMNLLGNEALGLVHQGFMNPARLSEAAFAHQTMKRKNILQIDALQGGGISREGYGGKRGGLAEALTGGLVRHDVLAPTSTGGQRALRWSEKLSLARASNQMAEATGQAIDVIPRRAAWLHEAKKLMMEKNIGAAGSGTRTSGKRALGNRAAMSTSAGRYTRVEDGSILGTKAERSEKFRANREDLDWFVEHGAKEDIDLVTRRAQRAMVDYESQSQFEREVLSRIFFFYPWLKGSTRLSRDLIMDHPAGAATTAFVANEWAKQSSDDLGPKPEYLDPKRTGLKIPGTDIKVPLTGGGETFIPELAGKDGEKGRTVPSVKDFRQAVPPWQTYDLGKEVLNVVKPGNEFGIFDALKAHGTPAVGSLYESFSGRSLFNDQSLETRRNQRPWNQGNIFGDHLGGLTQAAENLAVTPFLNSKLSKLAFRNFPEEWGGETDRQRANRLAVSATPTTNKQDWADALLGPPIASKGFNQQVAEQKFQDDQDALLPRDERQSIKEDRRVVEFIRLVEEANASAIANGSPPPMAFAFNENGELWPSYKRSLDNHKDYEIGVAKFQDENMFELTIDDRMDIAIEIANKRMAEGHVDEAGIDDLKYLAEQKRKFKESNREVHYATSKGWATKKQLAWVREIILKGDVRDSLRENLNYYSRSKEGRNFNWSSLVDIPDRS